MTGKTPCITTYPTAPGVITLTVGTLQCTLWSQSPTAGQVQAACCNTTCGIGAYSGPLVLNTISTISGQGDVVGGFTIPTVGWVLWLLSPSPTAPGITYQVARRSSRNAGNSDYRRRGGTFDAAGNVLASPNGFGGQTRRQCPRVVE